MLAFAPLCRIQEARERVLLVNGRKRLHALPVNAVGRGQVRRAAEGQHKDDDHGHQRPVDDRDVDLSRRRLAGVGDPKTRNEAKLDRLLGHRESARDHRLAGDDSGGGCEQDERQPQLVGRQIEERVLDLRKGGRGVGRKDHRPLPHVIEQQGRQHEVNPRNADRLSAEMSHVGVERLGTGDREDDRTHGDERAHEIGSEEMDGVHRVEHGGEYRRVIHDVADAEHCKRDEVEDHHRPEHQPHSGGPARLAR